MAFGSPKSKYDPWFQGKIVGSFSLFPVLKWQLHILSASDTLLSCLLKYI